MAAARSALIVATASYTDPGLLQLAPSSDAEALAVVLRDPQIGGFDVRTVIDEPAHHINLAAEEFFADRHPDDLLLVHFSCQGLRTRRASCTSRRTRHSDSELGRRKSQAVGVTVARTDKIVRDCFRSI